MAATPLDLSENDIEAIVRAAATEVGHGGFIRSHPETIRQMAEAVADTIINRVASPSFPNSVNDVVNQRWQFSAINAGRTQHNPNVYGSWQNVPDSAVNPYLREAITGHLQNRARGAPSRLQQMGVPGALNFANPRASSPRNRDGWIADMQRAGAQRLGIGSFEHFHGTDPNTSPLDYSPQISIAGMAPSASIPNPATDFNQQELAAIAPKTPAMPDAIRAARMPTLPATPSQLVKARIGNVQTPPTREAAMQAPRRQSAPSSQSSFPSRPNMGQGGLPAAPSGGIDAMRTQAQQTFQSTQRPQAGPFPVTGGPMAAPQAKSPDQFQYSRPATPAPTQRAARSPSQFQYNSAPAAPVAPAGPSMDTMLANYGARALQSANPFAAPAAPAPAPAPSVPNPVAVPPQSIAPPMQLGGKVPTFASQAAAQRAAQIRSGKLAGAPQRGVVEQAFEGFNDWIGSRAGPMAGAALGGVFGGPIGAVVGGLGGYGVQQAMGGQINMPSLVQGTNLPSQNTPNWQDNTGLPTWASVTGGNAGGGASAYDAWADSIGSDFY